MNYKIIYDEEELKRFIDWLPDLKQDEKFYCALFSRKKYCKEGVLSSDKAQLKRFLSDKERLFDKIKQLEAPLDSYKLKTGPAPQESLAFYISPNPRNLHKATYNIILELTKALKNKAINFNPHQEAMSCIQKTCSRKIYLDFDFDNKVPINLELSKIINLSSLNLVVTRGGAHVLVEADKVEAWYRKSFYKSLLNLGADKCGDQLLPVPGCCQGGFVPRLVQNLT